MPRIALTVRLLADHHKQLEESAASRGWSLQQLATFLLLPCKPATREVLDHATVTLMVHEWETAGRIAAAKVAAAKLIAEARKPGGPTMTKLLEPLKPRPEAK